MKDQPGQHGAHGMNAELERGDDAKIAAPAANGPKEVFIFVRAGWEQMAFRGDDIGRKEIIEGATVFADHPAKPAAEGETTDASGADEPASGCDTEAFA